MQSCLRPKNSDEAVGLSRPQDGNLAFATCSSPTDGRLDKNHN